MKKFIICFIAFLSFLPFSSVSASSYSGIDLSFAESVGSYALADMILEGAVSEIDFDDTSLHGDYTFLQALGLGVLTGDWSALSVYGFDFVSGKVDSFLSSINDWIYTNLPDLYEWWYGGSLPGDFVVNPSFRLHSLGSNVFNALSKSSDFSSPAPDPDFSFLVNLNNLFLTSGSNKYDFFSFNSAVSKSFGYTSGFNPHNYTWFSNYNVNVHTSGVSSFDVFSLTPVMTIYLNESGSQYIATYSSYSKTTVFGEGFGYYHFDINNNKLRWDNNYNSSPTLQTSFGGLSTAVNYIYSHFANVNLYVNGKPWVLVNSPVFPIDLSGVLTLLNSQPAKYYYPSDIKIDLTGLTTAIKNAISNHLTIDFPYIDDFILDINGQKAVAVVNIQRTDYDNMISEAYPFDVRFYTNDEYLQDIENGVAIINNSTTVFPSRLFNTFLYCAIILLFGLIVRRLIE